MLGGHLAANVGLLGNALPYVQDGKFRALAISSPQRSALLPDVPTFRELGMAEAEAVEWFGMFVAKGTPAETVKALGDATRRALATPEFRAGLAKFAMDPGGMSPEELARTLKSEHERWGGIVKASGFQPVD